MKKTLILAAALILGTGQANAQEVRATTEIKPIQAEARTEIQGARADMRAIAPIKGEMRAFATATRDTMKIQMEKRASSTEMRKEKVEARMEKVENRMEKRASSTEMRKEKIEDRMEARKDKIEARASSSTARVEARKEKVEAKVEARLAESAKNTGERATRVVARLKEIAGKIEARITKNSAAGSDVSAAKSNLVIAQAKIAVAEDAVRALVAVTINPSDIKGSIAAVRTAATTANIAIREAQESLNMTVQSIK